MRKTAFIVAVVLCLLLVASGPASSQTRKDPCANPQTQLEMNQCQAQEYKKADAELNVVYKQFMAKLDDEGERAALRAAQQAWLKFRDAECLFESHQNKGGTIYPLVHSGCLTALTQERSKQLRELLKER